VKWFLVGSLCLICSATLVRGDAAADLYNKGVAALQAEQYADAAQSFDSIITGYPLTPNIDDVRIRAGFSYLHAGKYPEAIDRLSKEAAASAKPAYRSTALYFTALAQFSEAQKNTDQTAAAKQFGDAAATLTTLINIGATPDNKGYLEQATYYRALAAYLKSDYAGAEKDLLLVIQQFPSSLTLPDYWLRLGSTYAVETNQAVSSKQSPGAITAIAQKALDAFDHVSRDPNALVQANDANMSKAEILFLVAQLDASSTDGYAKALDAFRLVKRKADMIPLQQQRLDQLKKQSQAQLQTSGASFANDASLLIEREENRLKDLQDTTSPDPIIQALIRMAECYVMMKQPDEARTILHRLIAHATLTADQQQEVDFQVLYSYVLGGQIDQANKALDAYLGKHSGDPQASSISYQIAAKLLDRKDYAGALDQANRSIKDFPNGKYVGDAISLKAQALNRLGRIQESDSVISDYLKANPTSPVANQMFLTKAQSEGSRSDFNAALADYKAVRDNASANKDLHAAADAGYIQTLNSMKQYDAVIAEAKNFQTQYPDSKAMPSVLLFNALALDQKHDPGAIAALQDVARKYPQDEASPFALFFVVNIYERANNVPGMIQASADLGKAFPTAYNFLVQAADAVSTVLIKQKKFTDAIALYQPLVNAPKADVAAAANNKIGSVWLAAAKSMGYYQSMQQPTRDDAEKKLSSGEQAYLMTLKNSPDQIGAVGDAFEGLVNAAKQRRSWGLLKDPDLEGYFTKIGADLTSPDMQARLEMAKAGLVFVMKDGAKQYPAALDRYRKVISSNPSLRLTRQETDQYGELLLTAKDYATAEKIYNDLLSSADPGDQVTLADANYGLGATALGQNDLAKAKSYFVKVGPWNPHIADASYGIALADEQGQGAELDEAQKLYAALMQNSQAGVALQAKAMLGYGRVLEKTGHCIVPTTPGTTEFGIHYYQQPNLLFGPAAPEASAEGLYYAGQALDKAGHKPDARKSYDDLIKTYSATAPDWAAKAQTAEATLGQ